MNVFDDITRCNTSSEPLNTAKLWEAVDQARNHIPRRKRLRTMGLILP